MPERIQLSRRKGSKMPAGAVKVDRTTRYGNPFRVVARTDGRAEWVVEFEGRNVSWGNSKADVTGMAVGYFARWAEANLDVTELAGKDLACWCPLDGAECHADVLLMLANPERPT